MPVEYREIDDYTTEEIVTGKLRPKQADVSIDSYFPFFFKKKKRKNNTNTNIM
jgi:hypothetical protein